MKRIGLTFLLLWPMLAVAAIDTYDFDSAEQRQRFGHFTQILRCPMCQNQNLSGSDSAVSEDLRRELHRLIVQGHSDDEIISFMRERYGEFILYDPPLTEDTLWLWLLPGAMLAAALAFLVLRVRRQQPPEAGVVSSQAREQAKALLAESANDAAKKEGEQ